MAVYKSENDEITEAWSDGVTLTTDTMFQCNSATRVSVASGSSKPTDPLDGLSLGLNEGCRFDASVKVYWRKATAGAAVLSSVAVSL